MVIFDKIAVVVAQIMSVFLLFFFNGRGGVWSDNFYRLLVVEKGLTSRCLTSKFFVGAEN
jgi:hypothetical protein